jgi:hypothetical protein
MRDLLDALKVLDKYGLLVGPRGKKVDRLSASEVVKVIAGSTKALKKGKRQLWTANDLKSLKDWYLEGYDLREIAEDLNRSRYAVRAKLSQMGIKRKGN